MSVHSVCIQYVRFVCLDTDAPQEDKNKHIACACANTIHPHAAITHCLHMHSPSFTRMHCVRHVSK